MMRLIGLLLFVVMGVVAPSVAKPPAAQVLLLHNDYPDGEALVVPASSPVKLKRFEHGSGEITATFTGRFTLSGTYEARFFGEDSAVEFWPDAASAAQLPSWRERGGVDVLWLENSWAFVQAVAPRATQARLKRDDDFRLRGRATIVADSFSTGIECDASHFSARFVSVVRKGDQLASIDEAGDDC